MNPAGHVLVTGGAGFIGSHLVERLLRDGQSVVVLDDCSTGRKENLAAVSDHPKLRFIHAKISNCSLLGEVIREASQIYHLAAAVGVELVLRNPVQCFKTNLLETEVLLEIASEHHVPFLLASSSEVYGKSQKAEFTEEDDLLIGPPQFHRWGYACSKLMDEFMALAYSRERDLPVIIARIFNTVGPRQRGDFGMVLPRFIEAALAGNVLEIYGDGNQTRGFCYVADAVEALLRLVSSDGCKGQVVNVGGVEEIRIRDLAALVTHELGSAAPIRFVTYEQAYGEGFEDMCRRRPCLKKLQLTTGFSPMTPLREIILRTAGR